MAILRWIILLSVSFTFNTSQAQPGIEGYWGHSEISVRLSTPEVIHTAPLGLSPRYVEADTLPPKSVELMDLGAQISERTRSLGQRLDKLGVADKIRVLDAYVRINLRLIGGDYEPGKAKVFRNTDGDIHHVIAPLYPEQYGRYPETVMYDIGERNRLRHSTPGVEIPDADAEADLALVRRHLPMDFATHLELLEGKAISDEKIREAITAAAHERAFNGRNHPIIVDYLRYNFARRLIAQATPTFEQPRSEAQRRAVLTEAKNLLESVRSANNKLSTPALHKLADVEITAFRLEPNDKAGLSRLEEGLRLLRLCKEEGDPTAVGVTAEIIRKLPDQSYQLTFADYSAQPETRAALAIYSQIPVRSSPSRTSPERVREENLWVDKLASLGLSNDASLVRLAAGLHDAGARGNCERVLSMCPQDDGVVRLIRAHFALERGERDMALRHLEAAEQDLRTKARRHDAVLSGHFEYGLKNETGMMYGRVLLEQASLLLLREDFLGAARKLRKTGMDFFNQEYVQGWLLTTTELRQLADDERTDDNDFYHWTPEDPEETGPTVKRDTPGVTSHDDIERKHYSSARTTLARRLLQAGLARESLPYWNFGSRTDARRYADLLDVAMDTTRTAKERGLAHWHAGLILRKNPDLWACAAGHALVSGAFVPPVVVENRASIKDPTIVGATELARIQAAKAWTAPRNSFFRYGLAEHCLKAAELLQGEQSAYVLWYGALALAYVDRKAAEPMRQKLLKEYASTKIGQQALAAKGLPKHVEAPEMK
jgi:hypothetical protein